MRKLEGEDCRWIVLTVVAENAYGSTPGVSAACHSSKGNMVDVSGSDERDPGRAAWDDVMAMLTGHVLTMGPVTTDRFLFDPKRLCFFLSRYKFAAKMLRRCHRIVDVGCGDGFGTLTFLADTRASILGVDFDQPQITYANERLLPVVNAAVPGARERLAFECMDFSDRAPLGAKADGIASLDVIEHIAPSAEGAFLRGIRDTLSERGIAVIGTPNDLASQYASKHSQAGHINMFTPDRLQDTLEGYFSRVFLFSMNDEMVHTGFDRMAHYLMALAVK